MKQLQNKLFCRPAGWLSGLVRHRFLPVAGFILAMALLPGHGVRAQEPDLFDLIADDEPEAIAVTSIFKTTRVVNGQSVENPPAGEMKFLVSHHFGRLNMGAYHFFGLDQATIRLGLEYGISDRLAVAAGRSSYDKTYDAFVKYKLLRQTVGAHDFPFTLALFSGISVNTLRATPGVDMPFPDRLAYVQQLLLARKFSHALSLQLSPAWVHVNRVADRADPNDIVALGIGGRLLLTGRISLNAEYHYRFNKPASYDTYNTLSVGFDIETGGHVFQLHFTNAQPMFERGFIADSRGNWLNGDIYFGFHIVRVFSLSH